jgi:hypothetical protein
MGIPPGGCVDTHTRTLPYTLTRTRVPGFTGVCKKGTRTHTHTRTHTLNTRGLVPKFDPTRQGIVFTGCIGKLEFIANECLRSFDPLRLPTSILEVGQLVSRMQDHSDSVYLRTVRERIVSVEGLFCQQHSGMDCGSEVPVPGIH